jgi:phosphoribosylformylglycinamidine cyclo-ligase
MDYKDSGVDLHEQDVFNAKLASKMPWLGGFSGALDIGSDYLVSSTDGVGTKVMLYNDCKEMKGIDIKNIGIDLVAMVMNDIVCTGAKPLFFNDYLAVNQLNTIDAMGLIDGINEGLKQCGDNVPLLGGETAIMSDMYKEGDFDVAGFGVGACPKDNFVDGSGISNGDIMLGLTSSGFHSNGYTLIRKILSELDDDVELPKDLHKNLLKPTKIYVKSVLHVMKQYGGNVVHGIAHITGGGRQNVNRLLGEDLNLRPVWHGNERPTDEMKWIQEQGNIDNYEMRKVFNNGIGMVLIVNHTDAYEVQRTLESVGETVIEVGVIGERVQN